VDAPLADQQPDQEGEDWIEPRMEDDPQCALIGVAVRPCRLPGQLVSPLLCVLPN
jgi:hypothetical protein